MELRDYLRVLRRRRWLVIVAALVCANAALGVSLATKPVYEGQAKLLVVAKQTDISNVDSAYQGALLSQQLVKSFAQVITSRPIAQAALSAEGNPVGSDPAALQRRIHADPVPDTLLIDLKVDAGDPVSAQRQTNDVATAFTKAVPQFQGGSALQVTLVEPALQPTAPVKPHVKLNLALGLVLGLLIGFAAALLAEYLDTTVKDVAALEAAAAAPVIGSIPAFAASEGSVPLLRAERSAEAEAFRKLRTNFSFLGVDRQSLCCVVTSAVSAEGKSTVAANLALALAQADQRVILIDADLRKPVMHKLFELDSRVGTTTVLLDKVRLQDALHSFENQRISVLAAGEHPPNPSELLGSEHMAKVVAEARALADVVLIDCAPVLVTDPLAVARHTDGVLLVARAGQTTKDQISAGRLACDRAGVAILGVVLNATKPQHGSGAYYYAYYGVDAVPAASNGHHAQPEMIDIDGTPPGERAGAGAAGGWFRRSRSAS